jgi:hypothetical protein
VKYKTVKALEESFSLGEGSKLEREILELEIKATMLDAIIEGFLDVVRAASREMSRRETERAQHD